MQDFDYLSLKSGSDIRGVAAESFPGQAITLSSGRAADAAYAYGQWLSRKTGREPSQLCVAVGRDCRTTSPAIAQAVLRTFAGMGMRALDCGGCTTPAMFMITIDEEYACDGAVMITASHLPWHRNGLKFFTRAGGLSGEDISEILESCNADAKPQGQPGEPVDYLARYAGMLRALLGSKEDKPLAGMHIVVDAGNGMGGFFAKEVLEPLGADISGSVNLEPDGLFPSHIPNPEDAEAMEALKQAVLASDAQLGISFDTDCDRAALMDGKGGEVNRNRLVAAVASVYCERQPGAIIVTDSVTSRALTQFIQAKGGVHRRYMRGYQNVIAEAKRLDAPVAIETSGHCALKENHYLDDGAYLVVRIIQEMAARGGDIAALTSGLADPLEERELRFKIQEREFRAYGAQVIDALCAYARGIEGWSITPDNAEGVRIDTRPGVGDGWILLRQSLHDPVLPLNVESYETGGVRQMLAALAPFFEKYDALDRGALLAALNEEN